MPTKKAKAKAKANAHPGHDPVAAPAVPLITGSFVTPAVAAVNADHLQNLEDALTTVLNHSVFAGVQNAMPIGISKDANDPDGGTQAGNII